MAKKKIPKFVDKMVIGKHLPARLQSYLRTVDLEKGRQAIKKWRIEKKKPPHIDESKGVIGGYKLGGKPRKARRRR